jgi:hypothetical protein
MTTIEGTAAGIVGIVLSSEEKKWEPY